ncbi:hypothetical protein DFH09DRAFT_1272270 [Mycena vulgaris]|nr:hypothetical protein DFH09DRAFT_1272270 [Mycena vulgaris]
MDEYSTQQSSNATRGYEELIDAFWPQPKLWIANVITKSRFWVEQIGSAAGASIDPPPSLTNSEESRSRKLNGKHDMRTSTVKDVNTIELVSRRGASSISVGPRLMLQEVRSAGGRKRPQNGPNVSSQCVQTGPKKTLTSDQRCGRRWPVGSDVRSIRRSGVPANMRVQNKATVKSVAASKFTTARAKAFAAVQWIHENMHLANITDYNPLKPDDFVIVLKNGAVPQVLLATVMTMYTKNTNHDWIPTATSVGTPSYIHVSVYRQFAGAIFSSMACGILSCPTVLQIPRTHILFSLASFTKITRQAVPTAEGYPHMLATLCPSSLELLQKLRLSQTALAAAVLHLAQLMKNNDGPAAGMDDQIEEVEEQEDAEMAGRF